VDAVERRASPPARRVVHRRQVVEHQGRRVDVLDRDGHGGRRARVGARELAGGQRRERAQALSGRQRRLGDGE
jgi:hypothetical protein